MLNNHLEGRRKLGAVQAIVALCAAITWMLVTADIALADGGPHGDYDKMMDGTVGATDKCAACHRPHQGLSQGFLLKKATQYELCASCHDGTVSRLDVLDGVKLAAAVAPRVPGQTVAGATLNGGGFEWVNGAEVTSKHNVRRSLAETGESQPWGYLADTGTKAGTLSQPLTCTSCHNPHGSANYRILREGINSRVVSVLAFYGGAFTKQEGGRGLEAGTPANKYTAEYYASEGLESSGGYQPQLSIARFAGDETANGSALLCGACHSSYPSSSAKSIPGGTLNPWGITRYRHRTEMQYDEWNSPKWNGKVPCHPENGPFNPGTQNCAPGPGQLPALRLASNTLQANDMVTCLTCHRAHGTATVMSGFALSTAFGGSSPDPLSPAQQADPQITGGVSKSMLLFADNRAMCEACHQW
ncbi:MAG: cytochrome c3 family protein [Chloroflexota bacterium]